MDIWDVFMLRPPGKIYLGFVSLTEASYLGPDSPRTSPRNETVKQCNLRATGPCNLEAAARCKPRVGVSVLRCTTIHRLFSVFSNINGEHESTLTTSKKYSWCIPVLKEIKPIIWEAAITPEPWNRQQCWFIFEDPNVRVARLLLASRQHITQATVLDARASRVKWPAQVMLHWYGILFTE